MKSPKAFLAILFVVGALTTLASYAQADPRPYYHCHHRHGRSYCHSGHPGRPIHPHHSRHCWRGPHGHWHCR
ncbi:MAG: hypothetical protein U1F57_09370 [bacterium]